MALVLTAEARRRISGVTNVTRRGGASRVDWWSSDFGQRYWRANVAVHLIDAAAVAPQYRANVVVWDDRCAWEARMDAYA